MLLSNVDNFYDVMVNLLGEASLDDTSDDVSPLRTKRNRLSQKSFLTKSGRPQRRSRF